MAKNKLFIVDEIEFLEEQVLQLKLYIEANPLDKLADRIHWKETKNGGMLPTLTASKEAQRKDISQALKDYAQLLEVVNKLRESEEAKNQIARGGGDIPTRMQKQ